MNFQLKFLATVQLYFKSLDYLYFSKQFFCLLSHLGNLHILHSEKGVRRVGCSGVAFCCWAFKKIPLQKKIANAVTDEEKIKILSVVDQSIKNPDATHYKIPEH